MGMLGFFHLASFRFPLCTPHGAHHRLLFFSLLGSNIAGLAGTTTFTDTNTVGDAPRFYRVRVE